MTLPYRYRHVETALAKVFDVGPDQLGAFRGRLRHLRNIGVPDLPKPGSGRQIEFTRQDIIEMMLALEFEAIGVSPRHAATYAKGYAKTIAADNWDPVQHGDVILITDSRPFEIPWIANSMLSMKKWVIDRLEEGLPRLPNRFAIINVVQSVTKLDMALRRAVL